MSDYVKIDSDIVYLPKQCYDLHVDKGAQQNRFTSDFAAFSKKRFSKKEK